LAYNHERHPRFMVKVHLIALSAAGARLDSYGTIEWHQRHPDARQPFSVKRMCWSWFSAELVRIRPTQLGYRVRGEAAYLALHDFTRTDGETTINGGSRSTLTDLRGLLTFVPAGSSMEGWNSFQSRVSSIFAVHLAADVADDISNVPPALYFENSNLKSTLQKLQSVLDGSGIDYHVYAETLGLLLLWELRHSAHSVRSQPNRARGGLTALQLRHIREFIDAQMANRITISDLAAVAGVSQFHFIRAFKDSIGLSPYQYVLSERIRRTKELLAKRDLSLANVAFVVGFRDASQLNRVFRRIVGVTPMAFRRDVS
jgi:AraC family transcriptional regulator